MSEGFREVFGGVLRGIRVVDAVLAGALTALGIWLMVENVRFSGEHAAAAIADGSMVHRLTSRSWVMIPVFALAALPVLWWRRNVLVVTGVALAVVVLHDLLFGWVTRCGAGLPLAFVLAYLGGVALERRLACVNLGRATLLWAAGVVVDATTGFDPIVLAVPILLIVFAVGRAVRHRNALS